MTFLPIVERELRVAARRRATYWTRLLIAFLAVLVGGTILLLNLGALQSVLGEFIFTGLSILTLVYCLFSGRRSTADCLSEEKREGTLGLLFLTDLNGYDVVLGKLVATSLGAFYGLLAVFPVLAIPLLMGGVTNGELWRTVLVLVDTFLFSLAIGIFASAHSRDARKAMAFNFALFLFFMGVLPAFAAIIEYFSPLHITFPQLFFTCAVYPFYLCHDTRYKIEPEHFWISVATIHALTWLLIIQASRVLPHSWQDLPATPRAPVKARWHALWHAWSYGRPEKRRAYRKRLLDINAFYWLAARARLKPLHVWLFLALIGCWWVQGRITSGAIWLDDAVAVMMALLLNGTLKLWVAQEAGQRLAEDKKIGALELLLSTPLTVGDILRGQWLALRRQFLKPVIVVLIIELVLMEVSMWYSTQPTPETRYFWLAGMAMLLMDLFTLGLVAMARALTAKTHGQAVISTAFQVLGLPWLVFGLVIAAANVWYTLILPNTWTPSWKFNLGWWLALGVLTDVVSVWQAWWQLHHRMRDYAAQRFIPRARVKQGFFKRQQMPAAATEREDQLVAASPPPAAHRRPRMSLGKCVVLGGLLLMLSLVAFVGYSFRTPVPKFPPPISVLVSLGQGPLRVFSGYRNAWFILPDGSLWCWGPAGFNGNMAQVPERFGTNNDWLKIEPTRQGVVGVRKDGTIWRNTYGNASAELVNEMKQLAAGNDWVAVSPMGNEWFAIKQDGSLWTQKNQSLGKRIDALAMAPTKLAQIGTDHDWAALRCFSLGIVALKTNGTAWAWGQILIRGKTGYSASMPNRNNFPEPVQLCRETNWVAFLPGFGCQICNGQGELWEPFYAPPDPESGASVVCRQTATNALTDTVAFAYCGKSKIFEIRADGTLWEKDQPDAFYVVSGTSKEWRRVGTRNDWKQLWSGAGTAFGLTVDGTFWTWGVDSNLPPLPDFASRLRTLRGRFGFAPGGPGMGTATPPQYSKEPRPLMQLRTAN